MRIFSSELLPPFLLKLFKSIRRIVIHGGSTGINRLDIKLIKAIKPNQSGYFVELGANDGVRQSNTFLLQERYFWTGLLIEPSPKRYSECVSNRAFKNSPETRCAACVPFGFGNKFVEIEDADLMSVAKGLDVKDIDAIAHANSGSIFLADLRFRHSYGAIARTLNEILDEVGAPSNFDLLSLDVEGNELSVLRGLDFDKYRPRWILVEVRDSGVPEYLASKDYVLHETLSDYASYSDKLFCRI